MHAGPGRACAAGGGAPGRPPAKGGGGSPPPGAGTPPGAAGGARGGGGCRRRSPIPPVAAFESVERGVYGIQFHPEVVHTPYGKTVLTNFLEDVCGCERAWSASSVIEDQIERIRTQVGEGRAICGLSGGVDSSVAALLVHRAIGDKLTCVFVDHGLMRKDEGGQVISAFRDHFKVPLVAVDAADRFLERLRGVSDRARKRKLIGAEFIRVFEEEAARLEDVHFLVQETRY